MKKLALNCGITLTVLMITIVIMVILSSTIIINVGSAITDTRKTTFASDLKVVEDAVSVYYIQNDKLPSDEGVMSEKEILTLSGSSNINYLREEFVLNGDDNENLDMGSFYKIDLSKLDIENSSKGLGEGNDVYVASSNSLKVYYLAGISADNTKYFSLVRLTNLNRIEDSVSPNNDENVEVKTVSGVTVKKQIRTWTNDAKILIQSNIASDESMYLSIAGGDKKRIETVTGYNTLSFGSLEDIKNRKANLKADILSSDIEYFNGLPQSDKYISIIKEKSGETVSNVKIDLSNYENNPPIISNILSREIDDVNIIEFNVEDSISGINNVYYEYLECYNDKMEKKSYYIDVYDYDFSYMRTRAKKTNISDNGVYQIKVPKNVTKIQITAVDNAGNFVSVKSDVTNDIYATVLGKNISNKNVSLKLAILSNKEVESVKTYISTNGVDFEDEKNIELLNEDDKIIGNVLYSNVLAIKEDIYVKIVVKSSDMSEYIRIVNLKDIESIEDIS